MEQVMSLPKEGGEIHLVGTAQHQEDLFFQLKNQKSWDWAEYKAIVNEAEKKVLWKELLDYDRLCMIRDEEIGERAFRKEYMCSPVWSELAYFQRTELMEVVNIDLKECKEPARQWKDNRITVVAGLDIGKKVHPSHLVIFKKYGDKYTMLFEIFMEHWDYSKQVDYCNALIKFFEIDLLYYDDTRAELEGFRERGLIHPAIWKPVVFNGKRKFDMASNFSRLVNNNKIELLNRQRMIDSILSVTNELEAIESATGHGDAFWSISLALYKENSYRPHIA